MSRKEFKDRNEQCRDWRLRRRYAGLCIQCGKKAERDRYGEPRSRCREHLDTLTDYNRNRRKRSTQTSPAFGD